MTAKKILLLPTKNEELAVATVIDEFMPYVDDILLVDGKSTDNTVQIAREKGVEVLVQYSSGKGMGIREGWDYILQKYQNRDILVAMVDTDGTCRAKDLATAYTLMERQNLDIITGNRFGKGKPASMPYLSYFTNWLISLVVSIRVRKRIRDVQTPFWVWTLSSIDVMRDGINARYFDIEMDMQIQQAIRGLGHLEIDINYGERIGKSTFSFSQRLRNLMISPYHLLRLR